MPSLLATRAGRSIDQPEIGRIVVAPAFAGERHVAVVGYYAALDNDNRRASRNRQSGVYGDIAHVINHRRREKRRQSSPDVKSIYRAKQTR